MKRIFVTGIGTEVGKTVSSAVLVEALKADYWKPIQSGDLDFTDSHKIKKWTKAAGTIHPETYAFKIPASPHYSSREEGIEIQLNAFKIPETDNFLVVEGAGGLLVPINERETILDLIKTLKIPLALVSTAYLGSINHTLLSLEKIRQEGLDLAVLIFTGTRNMESESIILKLFPSIKGKVIWIDEMTSVDESSVEKTAGKIKEPLKKILDELD